MKKDSSYRFTKQELMLRFFAFYERKSKYEGHLAKFLNDFMHDHRNPNQAFMDESRALFTNTVDQIVMKVFESKSPKKLPITILEALMVGIAMNLQHVKNQTTQKVRNNYDKLLADPKFADTALREGLSKKPRVNDRLDAAIAIFSK